MTIFLLFSLIAGVRAESVARLADPSLLEAPVAEHDPLVVLKRLWQAGARGPFFHLDHDEVDSAHYLLVEDWAKVGEIDSNAAILFRDAKLRELVGQITKIGTPLLVSSGQLNGGLAFLEGQSTQKLIADVVPALRNRSVIAITAIGSLYSLQHELAHHWDDESGFSQDLLSLLMPMMKSSVEKQRQADLEAGYKYIHEARAYRVELASFAAAIRPREWQAYQPAENVIAVREVDGPTYRREEFEAAVEIYNKYYAGAFIELPWITRWRVGRVAKKLIPFYGRDFARGRFNPCEYNLLEDLHQGRLMGSR